MMSEGSIRNFGKVAVLMGGDSTEREISLKSGAAVFSSLEKSGVDVQSFDLTAELMQKLKQNEIERVFIILHGRNGEDGKMQAALENIDMPYTGSGVNASELAMDKTRCKQLWQQQGLSTPKFVILAEDSNWNEVMQQLGTAFVKPVKEGSSIGIAKVKNAMELEEAYKHASQYDDEVIAETWIDGPEYTVSILGDKVLPVIELKTNNEFYDYEAKYEDEDTQYLCPCDLSEAKSDEIKILSKQAYQSLGCEGWGRVDLMQDKAGKFWLLEVNTIPGMTDHSLVPMAAKEEGINFEELVLEILASSNTVRRGHKNHG